MKSLKGIFAVIAMVALCVVMAGCASGSGSSASASAAASTSAAASASASAATSASAAASDSASASASASAAAATSLQKGEYSATFNTDSSMFHANEADDGKGVLTVADDGSMTIHVRLASTKIVNLFVGTAEEAQADGAVVLEPTSEMVKYSDGTEDEAYAFDVPVPALDEEFDVAILGAKGTWYDHKVSVSDPEAL